MSEQKVVSLEYWAGLFDGEGCIRICRGWSRHKRPRYTLSVKLANTNQKVIILLKEAFGGSWYKVKKMKPHHQDAWEWILNAKGAEVFLRIIKHLLIIKKEEAEVALIFKEKQREIYENHDFGLGAYSDSEIQQLADCRTNLLNMHPSGNGRRTYPKGW